MRGSSQYQLKEWFEKISEGDAHCFRQLYDHYRHKIFYLALKLTKSNTISEEILQEVCYNLWNSRSQLAGVENPEAYIYTITHNLISRHFKKAAKELQLRDNLLRQQQEYDYETADSIQLNESNALLNKAILQLPPKRRQIYQLSRIQGLNHEQIAAQLNISVSTVSNQLGEALKFIRHYLKNAGLVLGYLLLKIFYTFF
ncbi:RNA polymerase sigma factor [Chitinophaga defluvii]|uniref:RNA polymerase sigma-70 factor n=1 Tax=Chitinophaga defluvii TaxID=3163343 RepID=A0ABV2TFK8_9BACT